MTRTTRRLIFYCATVLFLAAGYVVVLYAQGYRYSFQESRFIRTGAVSIKTNTQAHILVDGVVKDTTSFITNSASVGSLLPGQYTITVQKTGYSVWQKKITIQEGFVQDFPHVMILPQNGAERLAIQEQVQDLLYPALPSPTPTPMTSVKPSKTPKPTPPTPSPTPDRSAPYYIDDGVLYVQGPTGPESVSAGVTSVVSSEDGKKLTWFKGSQVWLYWLADENEQPFHKQGDMSVIARFSHTVQAISWFRGSEHIAVDANGLKIFEIDVRGGQNIINL